MEGILQLRSENAFTVGKLDAILAGQITLQYTPASSVVTPKDENYSFTPAEYKDLGLGLGPEMPVPITRLFLLLQADSLIKTEPVLPQTVARLLDFYQFDIYPRVLTQAVFASPTAQLLLPVYGAGKVNYQGYVLQSADIHDIFSWQPLPWPLALPAYLRQDASFGLSYLVYTFIQVKKIYQFAAFILPESIFKHDSLFPDQLSQLEEQLNAALAQPHQQVLHLSGLVYLTEKLLAKLGEHLAQVMNQYTPYQEFRIILTEQWHVSGATLHSLINLLVLEDLSLYETGAGETNDTTSTPTNRLLIQPFRLLQNLEQIMALVAVTQLTSASETNLNIPPALPPTYRNQVLNVLKGTDFDELIRNTITFMYATVASN